MSRRSPAGRRRGFTLLELLVVLLLLGLSAAAVLPALRVPAAAGEPPLARTRTLAVRRGETLRLDTDADGRWRVVAAADTAGSVLLDGRANAELPVAGPRSVIVSALGTCLPHGSSAPDGAAWDPVRCAVTRR